MVVVALWFLVGGVWMGYGFWPSLGLAVLPLAVGALRAILWLRVLGRRRIRGNGSELEVAGTRVPVSDIKYLFVHRGTRRPEWAGLACLPKVDVNRHGRVPIDSGSLLACTPAEAEDLVAAIGGWAHDHGVEWKAAEPAGRWGIW